MRSIPARITFGPAHHIKGKCMTREGRFIWKDGEIEIHRLTVWAISIDADRNQFYCVELVARNLDEAAHRAIDRLCTQTRSWATIVIIANRELHH